MIAPRPIRKIHRGVSEVAAQKVSRAVGAASTGSPEAQSFRLTVAVRAGWIPKACRSAGRTCTRAYLTLLGQRVVSAIQTGEDVDYTCALDRHIALPSDELASQLLDVIEDAVCSVDITEEAHPDESSSEAVNPRVLCGNRVALWRLLSAQQDMPTEKSPRSTVHRLLGFNSLTASWRIPLSGGQTDQLGQKPFVDIDVRSEHVRSPSVASKPRLISPELCALRLQHLAGPQFGSSVFCLHRGKACERGLW